MMATPIRSDDATATPNAVPGPEHGLRRPPAVEFELVERYYSVRVARTVEEVLEAQRVRYEVFNVELGEGLSTSSSSMLDADVYDEHCDHLLLVEKTSGAIVGTYRLQTAAMARAGSGFYCAGEFDLSGIGEERLEDSVELGRACILREHRMGHALFTLWRGVARYAQATGKHHFFGCCSLTGTDPRLGLIAARWLEGRGKLHPDVRVEPVEGHGCFGEPATEAEVAAFEPPNLFGAYLRYGVLACGPPAVDHEFGTIDFLVLLDTRTVEPRFRRLIFEG
ncbi:GNAT family N-acetyltransferase [Engelhardtia mirabilis]|uniref:Hemolysin n=1 Tax=Engelhardtia mirabilis TaxID=2528011 RepID=A0A518BF28_9BACT|nr:hypothetical protein Pla133_06500 [Planctomycetes bacterium Pla133]QDU99910.1 hypothetical protein Pla86_06490 [Planctomycetes bacterium Pla86]